MVAELVKESLVPAVTSRSLSFQERRRCALESNPAFFFLYTEENIFLSQMLFSLEKGCETLALKTEVQCQSKKAAANPSGFAVFLKDAGWRKLGEYIN